MLRLLSAARLGRLAAAVPPRRAAEWRSPPFRCFAVPGTLPATAQDASPPEIQSHSAHQHAVISTFDLFSIGIGPSSSHTLGPLRAAGIFIGELEKAKILEKVARLKVSLYGSLAATGRGHMTVEALMMGFMGEDAETIETSTVLPKFKAIGETKALLLAGKQHITFDLSTDVRWNWDRQLPEHPNGLSFSVYNHDGDLLAVNEYFSIGGGFVVTAGWATTPLTDLLEAEVVAGRSLRTGGENLYYKETDKTKADPARRRQDHGVPDQKAIAAPGSADMTEEAEAPVAESQKWALPPYPYANGKELLQLCHDNNLTIAQIVWENEKHYLTDEEIRKKLLGIFAIMDRCIAEGVTTTETHLPGSLNLRRRAPKLYKRLMRGFYPNLAAEVPTDAEGNALVGPNKLIGRLEHPVPAVPPRKAMFPALEWLSTYAIAVNEVNAAGGRIIVAPTAGACGVIPSVLKYVTEFVSIDAEKDILTFLLTAAAVGMLFKRGATISAAEGGCMAEVGVATSMASAGFTACMGGTPAQILQAAEIGIEHSLGLTCDPIDGLVQAPCIERNGLGASKAVAAAQLALSGDGQHLISFDAAVAAMKETAQHMSTRYKETSMGGLALQIKIPLSVPAC